MRPFRYTIMMLFTAYMTSYAQDQQVSKKIQEQYEHYVHSISDKKWDEANLALDSLLQQDPENNYWHIGKAKVEAQLGNTVRANDYLLKAYQNGYRNLTNLLTNSSFTNLKNTKAYGEIVQQLSNELSQYKLAQGQQDLIIDIPPLMECYVIMLYLGNPNHKLINRRRNHPYFERIDSYFKDFKEHPLVLEIASLYPGDGEIWINNLRAHHNLKTLYAYDSLNIDTITRFPLELNNKLAKTVSAFAEASSFMTFYKNNKEFYEAMINIMRTNYSFGSNVIPFFNENFKDKLNRFNIYFSPIYGGWQHGPTAQIGDYAECFYFGGIMYTNTEVFYYPDEFLLFTFLTEFDHTNINRITATYKEDLEKLKHQAAVLNTSGKISYAGLESTINEYITWAFALQFFHDYAPAEYDRLKAIIINAMVENRGFSKFGEFMEFYEIYISNREKYSYLSNFYPEIVDWIEVQK